MSLKVSGSSAAVREPVPEGTHLAVCNLLVDLGMQVSEKFGKSMKVLIGWEIPGEVVETGDGPKPMTISKRYTASLNERATLRQDLAAWRGRDFTPEELEEFNLRNIVGASCLINVAHVKGSNGKTYDTVQNVMALPKGMAKGKLSGPATVYDIDDDPLAAVEELPQWIRDLVTKSETYQAKLTAQAPALAEEDYAAQDDEDGLPF